MKKIILTGVRTLQSYEGYDEKVILNTYYKVFNFFIVFLVPCLPAGRQVAVGSKTQKLVGILCVLCVFVVKSLRL
jgi:hypothetical protein